LSPLSGSDGARGQELEGIFGGVGSGRLGLGIRNKDIFYPFSYFVFRVSVADDFEINYRRRHLPPPASSFSTRT